MSRLIFAALTSFVLANAAAAQRVAGRDLLDFPLGLTGEAAPLSSQMIAGLWNPAAGALQPDDRHAFGVAGLTTPQPLGVRLAMFGGSYRLRPGLTASFSAANASVSDILHTETDPNSLGAEIPYSTTLLSLGAEQRHGNVTVGAAARYRAGTVDTDHASAFGVDAGVIVDGIARTPIRVALSTFLFSPGRTVDAATYMAAADVPLYRYDSSFVIRGGYSVSRTEGRGHEQYAFGTSAYKQLDFSAGMAQTTVFGSTDRRWRLGCGLRYASYKVAVGREDGAAGFGSSFQFLLTRVIR